MTPNQTPPWERTSTSTQTQTILEDGTVLLSTDTTFLDNIVAAEDGEPYDVTLPDGNFVRQVKQILVPTANHETTAQFMVTGNFAGFTELLFDTLGTSAVLEWDGAGWHLIGGNATPQR